VSLPLTPGSDRARPMPGSPAARQDDIDAALRSLREEQRRLERLGLELPLARCHHESRYWNFLAALLTPPSDPGSTPGRGGIPCPDDRAR
jgi:hypothetical protein